MTKTFEIRNLSVEEVEQRCKLGDILYVRRKAGLYEHVGIFLGLELMIHVKVGVFSGYAIQDVTESAIHAQKEGKFFRFDNIANFVGDLNDYKVTVCRLLFCPFTK